MVEIQDLFSLTGTDPGDIDTAMAALANERRKLREFHQAVAETTTNVRSKDRTMSATFDGRGELTGLKFHSTRYRELAPAQLADAIVALLAEGRTKALRALADLDSAPRMPGIDFADLVSGKADLNEVMGALLGPLFTDNQPDDTAR